VARSQRTVDRLAGCETLDASLFLSVTDPPLDWSPLDRLERIEGQLWVAPDTPGLSTGPAVEPAHLPAPLEALRGLRYAGALRVERVRGRQPLSLWAALEVSRTLQLTSLLELTDLGGPILTGPALGIELRNLPALADLRSLGTLAELESLSLSELRMETLAGLGELRRVGHLELGRLDRLRDASALSGLEQAVDISLHDLPRLERVDLSSLDSLDALWLEDNPLLSELSLGPLRAPLRSLYIRSCPSLTDATRARLLSLTSPETSLFLDGE
jgi:hypothetical protein